MSERLWFLFAAAVTIAWTLAVYVGGPIMLGWAAWAYFQ